MEKAPRGAEARPSVCPPHVIFCEVYGACHTLYSARTDWTAADVLRVSLSLYLVRQGFRRGYLMPNGPWSAGELSCLLELDPLTLRAADSEVVVAGGPEALDRDNPTGAVFPPADGTGTLTWICSSGVSDLELWGEPLPAGASYGKIEPHLRRIQALLGPLGYTASARVE